ncbi:MAG: hypothetical protein IPK77_03780 [Cellvibrio sp.]|nr:hypothetical protein [Cellvibrio sp.]
MNPSIKPRALWYKLLRYIFPQTKASSLEAIGRASRFLVITEILLSVLVLMVVAPIRISIDIGFQTYIMDFWMLIVYIMDFLMLIGFLVLAVAGSFISLKSLENTHAMNVKMYAATCFVPNLLISSLLYYSEIAKMAAIIGVPLISIVGGYFLLKKYPQMFNN